MIKAVAFDFGSTLYDVLPRDSATRDKMRMTIFEYFHEKYRMSADDFDKYLVKFSELLHTRRKETEEHVHRERTTSACISEVLREMGFEPNDAELVSVVEKYHDHEIPLLQPIGKTVDVISDLSSHFALACVSNNPWPSLIEKPLQRDGIRHCFEFIISSSVTLFRKPSPLVFEMLLKQWKRFSPENILFIGDSPENDIYPAQAHGMKAIYYSHPQNPKISLQPSITDISEIYGFLATWNHYKSNDMCEN